MTWSRRYVLKSYIRASLWVVPFFAVLLYWAVSRIAQGIGDWLMRTGRIDEATSFYALNISFLVFTFGSLLVAIQVAGGQYTPRIIATTLLRDNATAPPLRPAK